ncbi:pyridoxamine 5'-phosphate oxidase-domain-containing protein [Dissophora ornata]|nr:pyridoxamine 5'-phosphate oxidase-domain-containing protein [Dissophora ornata]
MHSFGALILTASLALFSATALALPSTPCHADNVTTVLGETHEQAAGLARNLVKNTGVGTFMSIMNADKKDGALEGYPFGSMDYYVDDCDAPGTPLMLLSHLQVNVQNARTTNRVSLAIRKEGERSSPMADPRVTLLGHLAHLDPEQHARAEACFVAQHPEAKWWLPGNGFHDFKWYLLKIDAIYYVGGFGGIHYIGWIDVDTYYASIQDGFSETQKQQSFQQIFQ